MCVDPRGDPWWQGIHRHPFDRQSRVGWHHTCRDDGQDSDGPLRQAPSRSLRPTGGCRVTAPNQADGSLSRQPRNEASAGVSGVRPGSSSHPHAGPHRHASGGSFQRPSDPRCRLWERPRLGWGGSNLTNPVRGQRSGRDSNPRTLAGRSLSRRLRSTGLCHRSWSARAYGADRRSSVARCTAIAVLKSRKGLARRAGPGRGWRACARGRCSSGTRGRG